MNHTVQREAVLQALRQQKHPTADEIYIELRKTMPQLSLGTVYRNLDEMAHIGIIKNLSAGAKQARFDYEIINHFHIRCIKCGKVKNIKLQKLSDFEKTLEDMIEKYKFAGYRFEFLYTCRTCSNRQQQETQKKTSPERKILTMFD